ncbi:MAG: radical SAM protein, partial [Candidatus Atribacteria bacterium]|nr:radical SAM protein [Candidatus Atribacteria bacterium]
MKIAIKTLGCKVNQAESCFIAASFQNAGFELVDFGEDADLFVVNGCAVTQEAEKKTRQMIHRLLNRNPVPLIFLIGCYAKRLISLGQDPFLHQVHFIDSPDKVTALIDVLCQEWGFQLYPVELPALHQSRIWLKVEDGCDHFCSYCIIPHLRGPVLSTASSLVIHQAQQLEERGIREIVLCGINLGLYGREKGSYFLIDLLEDLVRETSSVRFRLSSIEPFLLDLNFLDRFFSLLPRVCSHFHIPLQSGSGVILRTMNRGYTPDFYRTLIRQIRQRSPKIAVSTDIITGFPGEGE